MNRRIVLILLALIVLAGVVAFGASQLRGQAQPRYSADVIAALSGGSSEGFARALAVKPFVFPRDYGAHPEFQTEWWYYTGNLATAEGRRFGFQFTIFRRALAPTLPARASDWATNQIYFAHFAVSDIAAGRFYHLEKFSRGAAGLAGAIVDPRVKIWIEGWTMTAQIDDATTMRLQAAEGPIAIDFTLREGKPPVLQGDRGLSAKSAEPGNASYYYSLTRLFTEGTLYVNGTPYQVTGTAWKDQEYSTSVLSADATGWDWFSLQLDGGREIMLYQIRLKGGRIEPMSHGTLVNADGSKVSLQLKDFQIEALGQWTSPHTGTTYPAGWRLVIQTPDGPLKLEVTPLMSDQEINTPTAAYWEGASRIVGTEATGKPVAGYGYVELTGYNTAARDRSTQR